MSIGSVGVSANLDARKISPHQAHSFHIPGFGRVIFTKDEGDSNQLGNQYMQTELVAHHFDGDGKLKNVHDLGSGLVQDNLVIALTADQLGTATNKAAPILANSGKYMYSGTGSTANSYDYQLGTTAGPASGSITPTLGFSGDNATMQYVGTISYTTSLAITEWGLFNTNSQGSQYNTSSDSFTSSTATPTSSPSWTVNTWAGYVVVVGGTPVGGYIISNTATALTIATGWYNLTSGGGAGSTPSSNTSMTIYPLMSDHKTFSVINVVNGDSIQFTYTLTVNSGG